MEIRDDGIGFEPSAGAASGCRCTARDDARAASYSRGAGTDVVTDSPVMESHDGRAGGTDRRPSSSTCAMQEEESCGPG